MNESMKAMVYYGDHDIRFEQRDKPKVLEPTDAIIRMTKTTICGTDLGIYKGKNPEIENIAKKQTGEFNGRILGRLCCIKDLKAKFS
ncbi:alcohol dehydrogenase catalytic domain-containing protein [Acinetobacter gerneri]|uniref:alcohol dehydrogenase catalytic domain-containing protein n=1 Tax=Acinetobacter gerneri TaxID=202952 RepID=UPI0028AC271A|nr:alcohol dehydrogenase catalytic domain-containing protein [Acinetobacter gerneri]